MANTKSYATRVRDRIVRLTDEGWLTKAEAKSILEELGILQPNPVEVKVTVVRTFKFDNVTSDITNQFNECGEYTGDENNVLEHSASVREVEVNH
jgi:hypothetical protein